MDGEEDVDRPVVERNAGEVGLDELGLRHLASGDLEHPLRAVEADDPSPLPERQARSRARPGAHVQHGLTRAEVGPTDDLRGDRDQGRRHRGRIVTRAPREGRRAAEASCSMASHEALDAVHGLDDLLVGGGVADPDVAGARGPERAPGHDPDVLLGQQLLGERLVVEPGRIGHAREAVEGAHRLEVRQADLVEAIGHVAAAAVVLGAHRLEMRLAAAQRLDGGELGGRWGRT